LTLQILQTIDGFAQRLLVGMPEPLITPVELAYCPDGFAVRVEELLAAARSKGVIGSTFEHVAVDATIQAALCRLLFTRCAHATFW
jgi:hypothetical protein